MFRNQVRPPTPPLDEITAERLLRGDPIDDLPDAFRPLGRLLADASGPATSDELEGSAAAAAMFVAAHDAADRTRRRTWSLVASAFTAFAVVMSGGTAVAAAQGALPEPIQQAAHVALGVVGISVPSINQKYDEQAPGESSVNTPDSTSRSVGGSSVTSTPTTAAPTTPVEGDGTVPASGGDGSNLPPQSYGNGNGPPKVPPGQAKKIG